MPLSWAKVPTKRQKWNEHHDNSCKNKHFRVNRGRILAEWGELAHPWKNHCKTPLNAFVLGQGADTAQTQRHCETTLLPLWLCLGSSIRFSGLKINPKIGHLFGGHKSVTGCLCFIEALQSSGFIRSGSYLRRCCPPSLAASGCGLAFDGLAFGFRWQASLALWPR